MTWTIDAESAVAPYEQLRSQITEQVRRGELSGGDPLPPVRRLAADLGLAPNTVARAYKELEQDGFVVTGGRRGTVVAEQQIQVSETARKRTVAFVAGLRELGLGANETMRLVRQVLYD